MHGGKLTQRTARRWTRLTFGNDKTSVVREPSEVGQTSKKLLCLEAILAAVQRGPGGLCATHTVLQHPVIQLQEMQVGVLHDETQEEQGGRANNCRCRKGQKIVPTRQRIVPKGQKNLPKE